MRSNTNAGNGLNKLIISFSPDPLHTHVFMLVVYVQL